MNRQFKYWILIPTIFISYHCFGQFDLRWKINDFETLSYLFISTIEDSDQTDFGFDFDTKSLLSTIFDSGDIDTIETVMSSTKDLKQSSFNEMEKLLTFSKRDNGDIDVKIIHFSKTKDSKKAAKELENNVLFFNSEGVKFRGIIDNRGNNKSFYLSENDKLNIALYCTLPDKQVNVNDSWSIDLTPFKANYQFNVQDYAQDNTVTLVAIDTINNELIATIDYNMNYKIDGLMYYDTKNETPSNYSSSYKARGIFNITTGRWIYLKGKLSFIATGAKIQNTLQTVELIPTVKFDRKIKKYK